MKIYEVEITEYREKIADQKSKSFLSKIFSEKNHPKIPNHPMRRN